MTIATEYRVCWEDYSRQTIGVAILVYGFVSLIVNYPLILSLANTVGAFGLNWPASSGYLIYESTVATCLTVCNGLSAVVIGFGCIRVRRWALVFELMFCVFLFLSWIFRVHAHRALMCTAGITPRVPREAIIELPFLVGALIGTLAMLHLARRQSNAMSDRPLCIQCGHSLKGLSSPLCPECGRSYSLEEFYSL